MVIDVGNYEDNDGDDEGSTDITIGPVTDADTGEVETPASETGDGSTPDDDDGGGSTTVVVPESPEEREKLKESDEGLAVGSGDTVAEAERDAASNPNFDADQGESVNKVEEELGTNQPLQNPEGSSPEAVQDALRDVASEERGSRAGRKAGEALQAIEDAQNKGRAEIVKNDNSLSVLSRSDKARINDAKRNNQGVLQRATGFDLFDVSNTSRTQDQNEPLFSLERGKQRFENAIEGVQESKTAEFFSLNESVDGQRSFSNELADVGSEIIRESEKGADRATDRIQELNVLGQPVGNTVASAELAGRGEFGRAGREFLLPGAQTELGEKRVKQSAEGIIQGPGTLAGFAAGASGATGEVLSNEIEKASGKNPSGPTFGSSVLTGLSLQASAAGKNPGRFATEEISEEVGEGISTAGVGLLAPTVAVGPSVDIDPNSRTGRGIRKAKDAKNTATGVVTGNLGTRVENDIVDARSRETVQENVLEQRLRNLGPTQRQERAADIDQALQNVKGDTKGDFVVERKTETDEGGIERIVVGEKDGKIVQAQRSERPVSRREFLQERISKANLGRVGALGLQAGAFASGAPTSSASISVSPDTTTGTPDTTTSPDRIDPDSLFSDTRSASDTGTSLTPDSGRTVTPDDVLDTGQRTQQGLGQDTSNVLDEGRKERNPPIQDQTQDETPTNEITTSTPTIFVEDTKDPRLREPEVLPDPSSTTTGTSSINTDLTDDEDDDDNVGSGFFGDSKDTVYSASVGSELVGFTADEKPGRLSAQDPTNLRPIIDG